MATSRRRERELARRRYERRRLREQQERARRRRRNTIAGATVGTLAVVAAVVLLALHLSGGSGKSAAAATPTPLATPTGPTPSAEPTPGPASKSCAPIKPNPPEQGDPVVPPVKGPVPTKLVVKDVKKGTGPVAGKGDSLTVTYIGIGCSTGTVFDSTTREGGQPLPVGPLETNKVGVIQGWSQGLVGVRQGGTRELVIPPDLAYGAAGAAPAIGPNATLIFLIHVVKVNP